MHWRPRRNAGAFGLPGDASWGSDNSTTFVVESADGGLSADDRNLLVACVPRCSARPIYETGMMRPRCHIGRKLRKFSEKNGLSSRPWDRTRAA